MQGGIAESKEQDRGAWLLERRKGIGGTDAAAIFGLSKYASSFSTYLEKIGEAEPEPDSPRKWLGRQMEPILAQRYELETGKRLAYYGGLGIVQHAQYPELIATPDARVIGEPRGVDFKTAEAIMADDFGQPGTDEIPPAYAAQGIHYMAVCDCEFWDFAVQIGFSDFRIYTLARDRELEQAFISKLRAWWELHVVRRSPPPLDSSKAAARFLFRRFPEERGPMIQADEEAAALGAALHAARIAQSAAEEERARLENLLKAKMGEAMGIGGNGWRCTWKAAKGRKEIDWEGMARSFAANLADETAISDEERKQIAEMHIRDGIAKHTRIGAPSRRFLFNADKEA